MITIPEREIIKRFQQLRNYERLYPNLRKKYEGKKYEVRKLKQRIQELEEENKQIEKLELQLEELRALKFGKKRTRTLPKAQPLPGEEESKEETKEKTKRSSESYRRKEPTKEKITDHLHLELDQCPDCGGKITIQSLPARSR